MTEFNANTLDMMIGAAKDDFKDWAKKISNSFQPDLDITIQKIEQRLNLNGFSLQCNDFDSIDLSTETGDEELLICTYSTQDIVRNCYLKLVWKVLSSGQQAPQAAFGAKLRYDVALELVDISPEEMDYILDSEVEESEDELYEAALLKTIALKKQALEIMIPSITNSSVSLALFTKLKSANDEKAVSDIYLEVIKSFADAKHSPVAWKLFGKMIQSTKDSFSVELEKELSPITLNALGLKSLTEEAELSKLADSTLKAKIAQTRKEKGENSKEYLDLVHEFESRGLKESIQHKGWVYHVEDEDEGDVVKKYHYAVKDGKQEFLTNTGTGTSFRKLTPQEFAKAVDAMHLSEAVEDDANDLGSNHIIMQLRKAITLNGKKAVKFNDGKSTMVTPEDAHTALMKYDAAKNSDEKMKLQNSLAKSYDSFKNSIK